MGSVTQAPASAEGPTQHTQNRAELVRATPAAAPAPRSQALSLNAMSVQDAWGFAKALAESTILPRQYAGNPGSVLWALEFGRGLGLDVITTIQSVHIIQGKATMSADLMASLTRRAGHRMRVSGDETRAHVVIFRADDPEFPFEITWTMDRARQAKLTGKDTWQQYPAAMLRARAISECVRMACPEVLHGAIYTPEERGVAIDEDGAPLDAPAQAAPQPTAQYTVTQERPTPQPAPTPLLRLLPRTLRRQSQPPSWTSCTSRRSTSARTRTL
ncbi:hypothetical protein Srufu_079330 (plasmid) [Streptomyces libani subsp. rufus]|nr:hypothetical protein Srufu_079330 [Streptomyces libani subsp. rufus]